MKTRVCILNTTTAQRRCVSYLLHSCCSLCPTPLFYLPSHSTSLPPRSPLTLSPFPPHLPHPSRHCLAGCTACFVGSAIAGQPFSCSHLPSAFPRRPSLTLPASPLYPPPLSCRMWGVDSCHRVGLLSLPSWWSGVILSSVPLLRGHSLLQRCFPTSFLASLCTSLTHIPLETIFQLPRAIF